MNKKHEVKSYKQKKINKELNYITANMTSGMKKELQRSHYLNGKSGKWVNFYRPKGLKELKQLMMNLKRNKIGFVKKENTK